MLADPTATRGQKWVHHWKLRLRTQTARRAELPPVYGNGAIEAPMNRVRSVLESRRWTFRNRARMNLLLELVRLADLRADDPSVYATDIRHYFTEQSGRPPRSYRAIYDSWGPKSAEHRTYSLWASPAAKAARELRSQQRKQTGRPVRRDAVRVTGLQPAADGTEMPR